MRRLCMLLCVCLLALPALAAGEFSVSTPFSSTEPEGILAAWAAEQLSAPLETGPDEASVSLETRSGEANRMLEDSSVLLCDTEALLMAGLQGYTAKDLRTDMAPVFRLAVCPLYLVMDSAAAEDLGIQDYSGFSEYIGENAYADDRLLARHVEADPADRAVVFLSDEIPLFTEPFWPEEIPAALSSGDAFAAVISGTELEAWTGEPLLLLCTLGEERTLLHPELPCAKELGLAPCPQPGLYLFASAESDAGFRADAASRLTAAYGEETAFPAGFEPAPMAGEELDSCLRGIFADYRDYMTAEGLYFYE